MTVAHVAEAYRHIRKKCKPGANLVLDQAQLKWYEIFEEPVTEALRAQARAFLTAEAMSGRLAIRDDLGFVILHRCAANFYFLLLQSWRGANELWEAVYYSDPGSPEFRPYPPAYMETQMPLRPTFCVWELGVVSYEARSWTTFLASTRDDAAVAAYLEARHSGEV